MTAFQMTLKKWFMKLWAEQGNATSGPIEGGEFLG
jgi:hypothetical protein